MRMQFFLITHAAIMLQFRISGTWPHCYLVLDVRKEQYVAVWNCSDAVAASLGVTTIL